MPVRKLYDEIDRERSLGRDVGREQSLDGAAEQSSYRLGGWISAEESTPSEKLMEQERKLRVLEALSRLPEREREALTLQQ